MLDEKAIDIIRRNYTLKELDTSKWKGLRVNGMHFSISAYEIEKMGHLSIMKARAPFGIMKMESIIIVPLLLDAPIYSHDEIKVGENNTLIIELYDTLISCYDSSPIERVKEKYSYLEKRETGSNWYDTIRLKESISLKGKDEEITQLSEEYLKAFISSEASPTSDLSLKKEKIEEYVHTLLEKGGVSTDIFKKKLGLVELPRTRSTRNLGSCFSDSRL